MALPQCTNGTISYLEADMIVVAEGKSGGSGKEVAAELVALLVSDCEVVVDAVKFGFIHKEIWEVKDED
jgi:hypothetical protein